MDKNSSVDLTKAYQQATLEMVRAVTQSTPATVDVLKIVVNKKLNVLTHELDKINALVIQTASEKGINDGVNKYNERIESVFNGRAFTEKDVEKEHNVKNKLLSDNIKYDEMLKRQEQKVFRHNYLEVRSSLLGVPAIVNELIKKEVSKLADEGNNTVINVKNAIAEKFKQEGVFKVEFANGTKVGMEQYVSMVARTARAESSNITTTKISKLGGTDLVQCYGNKVTCKVCAMYRDRVFSVSGDDKRFPPLRDGVNSPFKHGYSTIHPNCRCEFLPYFEDMQAPEQLQEDVEFSNQPFKDDRTLKQKEAYQNWQAKNRQLRDEANEYNYMKAKLGASMPYKTLGGFRRAIRSDELPTAIKKLRYENRDRSQYDRWKAVLGDENMPSTLDKFQEMKYNKIEEFEQLQQKKETAYLSMVYDEVKEKVGLLSNEKARKWYIVQDKRIPNMIDRTQSVEEMAKQACALRIKYRDQTRNLMSDLAERENLEKKYPNKSFEELVESKMLGKGLTYEQACEDIIKTATKTNAEVNKKLNLED